MDIYQVFSTKEIGTLNYYQKWLHLISSNKCQAATDLAARSQGEKVTPSASIPLQAPLLIITYQ